MAFFHGRQVTNPMSERPSFITHSAGHLSSSASSPPHVGAHTEAVCYGTDFVVRGRGWRRRAIARGCCFKVKKRGAKAALPAVSCVLWLLLLLSPLLLSAQPVNPSNVSLSLEPGFVGEDPDREDALHEPLASVMPRNSVARIARRVTETATE